MIPEDSKLVKSLSSLSKLLRRGGLCNQERKVASGSNADETVLDQR